MEYKRFDHVIVARIDKGEEILEQVKKIALQEKIKLANLNAIGATSEFQVGVRLVKEKKYKPNNYQGDYEIVSLSGSINTMNKEFYSHIHMSCSDYDGNVVGGHLNRAISGATVEMFIYIIDGEVDRYQDPETEINFFQFQ